MLTRLAPVALVLLVLAALAPAPAPARASSTLDRPEDPVVLTGADVPSLQGVAPAMLVAFAYDGGWLQIPVQVDERLLQTFSAVYDNVPPPTSSTNISVLVYADPNTFTGPDPNPNIDPDDEIAFMAKDAGGVAPAFIEPAHVASGSGVRVTIIDPLQPGATGYVYLFRQDGTLDPGAGQSYVAYSFNLLSGDYKTTYNIFDGPNPEDSTVATPYYARRFSDRWADDALSVTAGVDILDRHKALFAPGNCARSEDTFDNGDAFGYRGEGAFIANKVGPVRAIRAYVGANSGPNTERDHIFYAQREDIRTYLRVHAIPSVMDFFDYSTAASGMTYANDLNLPGVTVDGSPDSPAAGQIRWEMVTGAQGSLVMSGQFTTNIAGFSYTSYYEDNNVNPTTQCTGDASAYGSSGMYVNQSIPCTDPGLACTANLSTVRTMYFEPPGRTAADAQALADHAGAPLTFAAQPWVAAVGGVAELPTPLASASRGVPAPAVPLASAAALLAALVALAFCRSKRRAR